MPVFGACSINSYNRGLPRLCPSDSIGIAHQFGSRAAIEVDYVNTRSRDEKSIQDNVNITFNPATGIPYPYSDVNHRAFPLYGVVGMIPHIGRSDYHGLQTSFTRRMSSHWQASLTYTLSGLWDQDPPPVSGFYTVPFPVAPDLGGERIKATPTEYEDRTTPDGKTSSVHWLRFTFTPEQIVKFKDGVDAVLGFSHPNYGHMAVIPPTVRTELATDFA